MRIAVVLRNETEGGGGGGGGGSGADILYDRVGLVVAAK